MLGLIIAAIVGEYILISPPALTDNWSSYINERKIAHPEIDFKLVNSFDIYNAYPFKGWVKEGVTTEDDTYLNAAESIHKYIRTNRRNDGVEQYYVLGGPWIDAENNVNNWEHAEKGPISFITGDVMSLTNAIPGVYALPRAGQFDDLVVPGDLFYACLDLTVGGTTLAHPWRIKGETKYFTSSANSSIVDLKPDVVVSRMPFVPWTIGDKTLSIPEEIAAYGNKVKAVESPTFAGRYRYVGVFSVFGSGTLDNLADVKAAQKPDILGEGYYTLSDANHPTPYSDMELGARWRFINLIYPHTRVKESILAGMPKWESEGSSDEPEEGERKFKTYNIDALFGNDWETVFTKSHGEPEEYQNTGVTREGFLDSKKLCKFILSPMTCLTGRPDYCIVDENPMGGKQEREPLVAAPSISAAALLNPNGGDVAGIHNGREGLGVDTPLNVANCEDGSSTEIETYIFEELFAKGANIGTAWKRALSKYHDSHENIAEEAAWVAIQEFLYGDPLLKIAKPQAPTIMVR